MWKLFATKPKLFHAPYIRHGTHVCTSICSYTAPPLHFYIDFFSPQKFTGSVYQSRQCFDRFSLIVHTYFALRLGLFTPILTTDDTTCRIFYMIKWLFKFYTWIQSVIISYSFANNPFLTPRSTTLSIRDDCFTWKRLLCNNQLNTSIMHNKSANGTLLN